jgi:glucuronate isomerase
MRQMNVALVCTTDDPTDTLEHHQTIAADASFPIRVLPTFRPDKAMAVESPTAFNAWVDQLAERSGIDIGDRLDHFLDALRQRHDFFHSVGCRLSDHGIATFYASDYVTADIAAALHRIRQGQPLHAGEIVQFKSAILHELAVMNAEKGWVQQFHFGPLRNNNTRMFEAVGPDTGFDSIGDLEVAQPMSKFFDRLDRNGRLTKTILYNINPSQNEVVATMIGNFQDGITPGKMQYGGGWWFLDQKDGMERQLNTLSNLGLLSRFVGMVTDSRSFLSYTRHEYFRRILCNLLGVEIQQGLLPDDMEIVGSMVRDICYGNAAAYFGFERPLCPTHA